MRTLIRADCAVLHLVLKKKWYDMIASGEKLQEYRTSKKVLGDIDRWFGHSFINGKNLVVTFALGYQTDRPVMSFLVYDIIARKECYHPEWGEPDAPHYVIRLREMVAMK